MAFPWPEAVVISSSRKDVVAGLVPHREDDVVFWHEGRHERGFPISSVETDTPERFRFLDKHGDWFELRPMTLDLYERHVRQRTVGKPTFATLDELLDAMRREW